MRQIQSQGCGFKRAIAHVSAKSHANGRIESQSPSAEKVTEDQIMAAPIIAHP
ncbi:MAG: hypothetical protein R2875_01805 [Desulfobacterales bacterium]